MVRCYIYLLHLVNLATIIGQTQAPDEMLRGSTESQLVNLTTLMCQTLANGEIRHEPTKRLVDLGNTHRTRWDIGQW